MMVSTLVVVKCRMVDCIVSNLVGDHVGVTRHRCSHWVLVVIVAIISIQVQIYVIYFESWVSHVII
jgi:hypothetical protein